MPIDETIESSLAPYRSDENCRLECLRSRMDEMKNRITPPEKEPDPYPTLGGIRPEPLEFRLSESDRNLLVDMGYEQRTIQNSDYKKANAKFYVRELGDSVDVLIERIDKSYFESTFTYFKIDKNELTELEKDYKRSMEGKSLSGKGLAKRLAEPATLFSLVVTGCLASATIAPIATISGIVLMVLYANRTHDGKDSYISEFLEYLSNKRIDKLNPEQGNSALLSALYLPGDNRNL